MSTCGLLQLVIIWMTWGYFSYGNTVLSNRLALLPIVFKFSFLFWKCNHEGELWPSYVFKACSINWEIPTLVVIAIGYFLAKFGFLWAMAILSTAVSFLVSRQHCTRFLFYYFYIKMFDIYLSWLSLSGTSNLNHVNLPEFLSLFELFFGLDIEVRDSLYLCFVMSLIWVDASRLKTFEPIS